MVIFLTLVEVRTCYTRDMDLYDKTKIGKKIADGGDRKVYMYDTDRVIKFSSLSFFLFPS
mgnify:CR=1 FL=1